jgi:transposase
MTRFRGRAPRGKRLYARAPQSHCYTTTMICSMRWDGSTACMTVDGATDTEVFRAYVQEVLCPTLRAGDVVIMDNLSPHKSSQTLQLIEQVGAQVLFLPPYSPDLNPNEKMWSKLKEFLRSKEARSLPTLIEAIGLALERITPRHAINYAS